MTGTMASDADQQRIIDTLRRELEARTAELAEARAERAATAEILGVINSSPANLTPVFEAILRNAHALCGVAHGSLQILEDGYVRAVAIHGIAESLADILRQPRAVAEAPTLQALLQGQRYSQVNDVRESESPILQRTAQLQGARTLLSVPLRREGKLLGMIVCARREVKPFTEREISLLESFATQAVLAIENARLFNETQAKTHDLEEALRYQTGSANILNVIASSPTNVHPVLKAIAESACELCGAYDAIVNLRNGEELRLAAHHGPIPMNRQRWPNDRTSMSGRAIAERRPVHVHDVLSDEGLEFAVAREMSRVDGCHTLLTAPLLREGEAIGAITLRRAEVHPFSDKQIALLQTFADQAVIALGNVRLFEEVQAKTHDLEEALRYQTGSANILNVIASSPTDVQPVLQAIVESACKLCGAYDAVVLLNEGDHLLSSAHHGPIPMQVRKRLINRKWTAGRAFIDRKAVHVHDLQAERGEFPDGVEMAIAGGYHSIVSVPLLREGESIGALTLRRTELHPFSDKQVGLLETFADQAVIAIGNVHLFEEVQARTRELAETLEYQTATSDVLNVISRSPNDLRPVMDTIVRTAQRLCASEYALILQRDGEGFFRIIGHANARGEFLEWLQTNPVTAGDGTAVGIAIAERKTIHLPDALADPRFTDFRRQQRSRARSMLAVPLMRDAEVIGVIFLARTEVLPFTDKQVELVTSFADQAVIAIENVRLFDEVQARTRDLQESLQQQTATADVLKIISRSTFDLQPVLDTLISSACRLCEANIGTIRYQDASTYRLAADYGCTPEWHDHLARQSPKPDRGTIFGRTIVEGGTVHIPDVLADPEFTRLEAQKLMGFRAALGVPLIREGQVFGALSLMRFGPRSFTEKQIELVETFADQAVIAIENVRLFEEVQARTRDLQESLQQQTATADVLKVISRSAFDLQTVLDTLVESAARLCEADMSVITRQRGETYYRAGSWGFAPEFMEYVKDLPIKPERATITGRTLLEGKVTHVHDTYTDPDYSFPEAQRLSGDPRTILGVPLLREGKPVGALALLRKNVRPFTDKQIELVTTFADQAVIAIENVRLFDEVQARTRELAQSLDNLRTAQDRLVQTEKLASLGQLTAGIAHEIKNPLNFVNNFAALSVELTDELNDVLKQASLADKLRTEADELTGLLKDNLAKVVQHGKRADSIVKNMLLHSREGSGEHRPADINALVDESLNLAYHGARAEKPQFNVTLQRNFDPEAGMVDVFPQEITRVFLNLLSNGFYAVTKRKADNGSGFEPTVSAMTKGRADGVEIRIRDNGTGIPPEVKEKMFNPFFTTKPAGEGAGLGLSMSHDIIVKQHGGTIDVDTMPGEFTEFTIVLPRTNVSKKN